MTPLEPLRGHFGGASKRLTNPIPPGLVELASGLQGTGKRVRFNLPHIPPLRQTNRTTLSFYLILFLIFHLHRSVQVTHANLSMTLGGGRGGRTWDADQAARPSGSAPYKNLNP